MPYGLPKEVGGDSPANVKWMEKCVSDVQKQGKSKSSAVAICKSQLIKSKSKDKSSSEYEGLDESTILEYVGKKFSFIKHKMAEENLTFNQALDLWEKSIIQNNYNI
jgi:hypothetical protein